MAVSMRQVMDAREAGGRGYLWGHPREGGYGHIALDDAYRAGWDNAQNKKPGVELQRRFQKQD